MNRQSQKALADQADREAKAAERITWLFGFDTEIRCEECGGYRQPEEICCRICRGHHKPGDATLCRFRRENYEEWQRKFGRKGNRK